MSDLMKRFLKSLKIEDTDGFDIDFKKIEKVSQKPLKFNYAIEVDAPLRYSKAKLLKDEIDSLDYSCEVTFDYKKPLESSYIDTLLSNRYFEKFFSAPRYEAIEEGASLSIIFKNEKDLDSFNEKEGEFISLLEFLNIPRKITSKLSEDMKNSTLDNSAAQDSGASKESTSSEDSDDSSLNIDDEVIASSESEEEGETTIDEDEMKEAFDKKRREFEDSKKKFDEVVVENEAKDYEERKAAARQRSIFTKGDYIETHIRDIDENSGPVDFKGWIFELTVKESKTGKQIARIGVTDDEDAIYVKFISNATTLPSDRFADFALGKNIEIKGRADYDTFNRSIYVMGHFFIILPDTPMRDDDEEEKRVELHLHTNMSEMDGITSISDYCALAKHMGHRAIALTDHGVVQAFPEAQDAAKKYGLKMLYGCELYMIDDYMHGSLNPDDTLLSSGSYVVFDLESTGLNLKYDRITEFGAVKIENGLVRDRLDILIDPERDIPEYISEKTHIDAKLVAGQPTIKEALPRILAFFGNSIVISHNIEFDYGMIKEAMRREGYGEFKARAVDTLQISRFIYPENQSHSLGSLCRRLDTKYDEESAHRADYDAEVLASCWLSLIPLINKRIKNATLKDIADLPYDPLYLKHARRNYHVTVLCKNNAGLKDLYKLVSYSHIDCMGAHPYVKRSILEKYRSNLLVGSACFNGELFYDTTRRSKKELEKAIKFYDYVEIQPLENYSRLVNMKEVPSQEELMDDLRDIIDAAEDQHKIIVATGDVHYRNPKDKKYRDVFIENLGVGGTIHPLAHAKKAGEYFSNPDQHYRSTREMLDAFARLGAERAKKYVVTNTNAVADMCEEIDPIPDKLFTPTIDHCEDMLKDICYKRAHELYGDPLPELIEDRLNTELNGIISNGYSVIYYIAHELVRKSDEAGYIVGSRGSVGSSFAATMAGITEVNPLPPHYRCSKCKHVEFVQDLSITSGYDLPEKKCPICGEKMIGDGQDIPFQTFLGFQAEKVPDIDLNFPTDFQARAHLFTKDLLGADKVFRAGTILTVQGKTAFGYCKAYYKALGYDLTKIKNAWIAALAYGCQNVKRTTGQHPGGIVVIPRDYDVYDFTPVQYPAGDTDATWKTTHFDFSSIHDTILKLDMLGHVDPQALKKMSDLTGFDARKVPMNDPDVLSLFTNDEALHLKHKYLPIDNGASGLPEFGTQFVRQMLRETKPKTFKDLVIISGLSHGTNVWTNNAQDLIKNGTTNLQGVIGCRDDIMTYLISKGIPPHISFMIMEIVRKKDKVLTSDLEDEMRKHGVPEYYIESCRKIKYLFPKGHACAYVMMALRVGYYKVHYPLEYYATFFTLRCTDYDARAMVGGIDAIHDKLAEFDERRASKNPADKLSNKEEEIEKTLQVALEMTERGYSFENIDLKKSDVSDFLVDYDKKALILPFKVIDGIGDTTCSELLKARKEREFTSKEDLAKRGKLSSTNIKQLDEMHVLDGLPDNDQCSIFDFSF
jgi:DNA polymerase-3 subunit alpha (Gram-positive type)